MPGWQRIAAGLLANGGVSMITAKSIIVAALCCAGTTGFLIWRYQAHGQIKPAHAVEVLDRSDSVTELERGAVSILRRALDLPGLNKGSTFIALTTGDASTACEPMLVAEYEAPISKKFIEGKAAEDARKKQMICDLSTRVKSLKRTRVSPIFVAVKRGVEQLRAKGCTPESDCYLFIKTDGEELTESAIKNALRGKANKDKLPAPIENQGIRVVFCGLSETLGELNEGAGKRSLTQAHDHKRLDRIREVWSSLFTDQEIVSFEPFSGLAEEIDN
jgi:hypothetical protein